MVTQEFPIGEMALIFKRLHSQTILGIWGDFFSSRTNKKIHSFVPTVSGLGFKNPNFNWSNNINRNLVCSGEIPFDNYYAPRNNTQHVSFSQESIQWLFKELDR